MEIDCICNNISRDGRFVVFIFGLPGAGKSTLANRLAEKHGLGLLSGSELLNDFANRNTSPQAQKVMRSMSSGLPICDSIVLPLYRDFITQLRGQSIIVDGNPANRKQLANQIELFAYHGYPHKQQVACFLHCSAAVLRARMAKRSFCAHCSTTLNESVCSRCGNATAPRFDDKDADAVRNRIEWVRREVAPAVRRLIPHNRRLTICNTGTVDEVRRTIERRFGL